MVIPPLKKNGLQDITLFCAISEEVRNCEVSAQSVATTSVQNAANMAIKVEMLCSTLHSNLEGLQSINDLNVNSNVANDCQVYPVKGSTGSSQNNTYQSILHFNIHVQV